MDTILFQLPWRALREGNPCVFSDPLQDDPVKRDYPEVKGAAQFMKDIIPEIMDMVIEENLQNKEVENFLRECIIMVRLYAKKNHDYGNSFNQGMKVIGLPYGIGRLYDKMNRIITLSKVKAEITDENIKDTIKDLACYSVMTSVYINNEEKIKIPEIDFDGHQ